jgi:hypothetical protein
MIIDERTNRPMVIEERTGWRDLKLSKRHKLWGFDCPAVDCDFILTEYDNNIPIALIEHKHKLCGEIKLSDSKLITIKNLGNMAKLPVFLTRYDDEDDIYKFWILGLNIRGIEILPVQFTSIMLTEKKYVDLLYMFRKRETPLGLFDEFGNLIIPKK